MNDTNVSSQSFAIAGLDTSNSSWGAALPAGFDYRLAPKRYVDADAAG